MNDALYVAATGLHAHQSNVETIANNVANIGTPTFKKSRVVFQNLMDRTRAPDAAQAAGRQGLGVSVAQVARAFDQGELRRTDAPLDLAIQGEGFIEVLLPDGSVGLSRGGTLRINGDGMLATPDGFPLKAGISIPVGTQRLSISANGVVSIPGASATDASRELGVIDLVMSTQPSELIAAGDGLYKAPDNGARLVSVTAGEEGAGTFVQGALESSNVKMVDEMVALMVAQRAYEMNVKVMQAADEMMAMSNNLRRG